MFYDCDHLATLLCGTWLQRPSQSSQTPVGITIDSREDVSGKMFVALRGARFDGHNFIDDAVSRGAVLVLVDRDIRPSECGVPVLRTEDTRRALSRLASAYRKQQLDQTCVIAITGSCGKTTTKSLAHAALRTTLRGYAAPKSFNNDIGVPLTLLAAQSTDDYVIVEIGTSAPGEIAALGAVASPDISVVTMVGSAHLEAFGSVEAIRREKLSLLSETRSDGQTFVNEAVFVDDVSLHPPITFFGTSLAADISCASSNWDGRCTILHLRDGSTFKIPLPGVHNTANALPAIGIARRLGCDDDAIRAGLLTVDVPEMRFDLHTINDITFVNDAYNANPESMRASISTFMAITNEAEHRWLVLGDMLELGRSALDEHRAVLQWLIGECGDAVDGIMLIGPSMEQAASELDSDLFFIASDIGDEISILDFLRRVMPGDAMLLKGSRSMHLERVADVIARPTSAGAT